MLSFLQFSKTNRIYIVEAQTYRMNKPKITGAADAELFQSNGSRIETFFELDGFVKNLLKPMIDASAVKHQIQETVVFDSGMSEHTDVFGLLFGDSALGFTTLIATNHGRETNEILGIFPVTPGIPQRVKIEEVLVWDNQLCATVRCSVENYDFAFFATDFYYNREQYLENEYLDIELAAFAPSAEEADKGFSFEGQKAVDWLAKMGQEPTYNADGTVQPVEFSTANLVAYLTMEKKAPDEAQFQSPAGPVESLSFVGIDLYKTTIAIRGNGADFRVPIILRKELIPNLEEGMPIRGYSCLIGRIVE